MKPGCFGNVLLNVNRKLLLVPLFVALPGLFVPLIHAAGPTTAPSTTQPSTAPTTQPSEAELREGRAERLGARAIRLLRQQKFADAERVLLEAVEVDPENATNVYNLACTYALQGKKTLALDWLEKAADAGFTDFIHLSRDTDLDALRDQPRYKQLVARKDRYQRRAAERAVAKLKARFGDGYIYEIDPDAKLIFATNTDRTTLQALKQWLTAQAKSQWGQLFTNKPDEFVMVVVPSAEHYKKLIPMPGVGGIYMDGAKTLIAQRLGQVMTHEFTHALHAADIAAAGQEHPIWLAEGFGSLFEAAQFDDQGKLVPADNFRLGFLQRAARRGRLIPLERLLKMEQKEFVSRATLAYGESSSLLLYLYEKGELREFYDAFKEGFEKDKTGKVALEAVTGMPLSALERDWKEWMTARTAPPLRTGPEGAVIGAALGEANDGMLITNVIPGGPAARAGAKEGDVIIGLNGREVRDYYAFVPMINEMEPGDEVTVKIRRGDKYLEMAMTLARRSDPSKVVKKEAVEK
jgi:hypothetical protein